jgi:hypothetical protein
MSKGFSMWVPGAAVVGQQPGVNAQIIRNGDEALFPNPAPGTGYTEWFQFPIPTPTVVQDKVGGTLVRALLLFDCDEHPEFGPSVTRVDVWHGANMIRQGPDISLADHKYRNQIFDGENIFDVNVDGIVWGVTVSVRVNNPGEGGFMHFIGAGADFQFDV